MKQRATLLSLLAGLMVWGSAVCQQLRDPLQARGEYSLLLFCLEKSVVRMERYPVCDVQEDMNYCSQESCNNRSIFSVDFTEPGMVVRSVSVSESQPDVLHVVVKRGEEISCYAMNWMAVAAQEEAMHDMIIVTCDAFPRSTKKLEEANTKGHEAVWCSLVEASWRLADAQYSTNFVFDRRIKSAAGLFVLNSFLVEQPRIANRLTRDEAIEAGFVWETTMPVAAGQGDGLDIEDESEDIGLDQTTSVPSIADTEHVIDFEEQDEVAGTVTESIEDAVEPTPADEETPAQADESSSSSSSSSEGCPFAQEAAHAEPKAWYQRIFAYILSWFSRK